MERHDRRRKEHGDEGPARKRQTQTQGARSAPEKKVVVASYRVRSGWSHKEAEAEMLRLGFHPLLVGLWQTWMDGKSHRREAR